MFGLFCFVLAVLASPFKSKIRLEAENAVLRHQLIVLRRKVPGQVRLTNNERGFLIQPACAAPTSSSGLVPGLPSKRQQSGSEAQSVDVGKYEYDAHCAECP